MDFIKVFQDRVQQNIVVKWLFFMIRILVIKSLWHVVLLTFRKLTTAVYGFYCSTKSILCCVSDHSSATVFT
jgi:hypothetical protein